MEEQLGTEALARRGRGLYSLRHVFRTVAGGAKDVEATRHIMGHDESAVEDAYIEGIGDDRLLAVANHVRAWLYAKPAKSDVPQPSGKATNAPPQKATKGKGPPPAAVAEGFQLRIVG